MEIKEYQEKSKRTLKDRKTLEKNVSHMIIGLMNELGELSGAIKAHFVYEKPLDKANVIEELGDMMWFWTNLCTIMDIEPENVLEKNILKLHARYPDKFTEEHALNRNLDNERKILEE